MLKFDIPSPTGSVQPNRFILLLFVFFLLPVSLMPLTISIRYHDHDGFTRIVLEGDQGFQYQSSQTAREITIHLHEPAKLKNHLVPLQDSKLLAKVSHRLQDGKSIINLSLKSNFRLKQSFVLENPYRLVYDVVKSKEINTASTPVPKTKVEEPPQTESQSSLQDKEPDKPAIKERALIETICIDPGHGGSDLGAIGHQKTEEKTITLKIAQKLKRSIVSKLGLDVIMTRTTDTEVSLNSRVSKANNQKAQLFISIHVNGSYRKSAWGSETFYASLKATDQEALILSQKENASFEEIEKIAPNDELQMILWNMAQNEHIKESSILAEYIQNELNVLLKSKNRGVKQAPFRVLMRAAMPAVLVEVAFLSNRSEEQKLLQDSFLERVANALYVGISKFIYYHNSLYK